MARFATPLSPVLPVSARPWSLGATPTTSITHEGGTAYGDGDARAELFNAAVSGLLADGFYETAGEQLDRLQRLVRAACTVDPAWVRQFIPWLRGSANLRSASVVLAAEYAALGLPESRAVIAAACQRADEPGEVLAYWRTFHGRTVPSRVKRGLSDACARLYSERATARWDGQGKGYRFGDVLEIIHAKPRDQKQSDLYRHLLDRRRHPAEQAPEMLPATRTLRRFMDATPELRASWRDGGEELPTLLSWERLAADTPGGLDAAWWGKLIMSGSLGGMALLRNLNNFDRAMVTDPAVVAEVKRRLTDPAEIAAARLLPYRFLTAYIASESDRWRESLEAGADVALANLPSFPGRTAIMVDCSSSMQNAVGAGKSRLPLTLTKLAAFVAEALGRRCDAATIFCYETSILHVITPKPHVGVLRAASQPEYTPRGGTHTWACLSAVHANDRFDRFVVLTDEQAADTDNGAVDVPVVTWNLAGYGQHQAHHGRRNRYLVSGYSDSALQTLPDVILHGSTGRWPWETA
jgi:hypothetical protein